VQQYQNGSLVGKRTSAGHPLAAGQTTMTGQEAGGISKGMLDLLRRYLEEDLGCHTAILYGSRARGDWEATSDIDVVAFRDAGETGQVAHRWQDLFLDLFLYLTATKPDPDWLRLHGGRVLFQRGSDGDEVLAAVGAMFAAGPEPLSVSGAQTRRLWSEKMLARAEKGDPEGNYRRHWLLMALLEDYFALRRQWYLGPKRNLTFLRSERPKDFAAFRRAFDPSASIDDIRAAVAMVVGS
jgi:hypothetical protein